MKELKLECLVEGYEGTYFEVGQVWETRGGYRLKVKEFDFETEIYKVTLVKLGDEDKIELYYTQKGEYWVGEKDENDLLKIIINKNENGVPTESIPSEESQPKTLSEYLKENNAYESFVENCVGVFLEDKDDYPKIKLDNHIIDIKDAFNWNGTKEGHIYWYSLHNNQPKNLVYDMNEIIFAEVDKRIAEQKNQTEFITTEEFDQILEQKISKRYMVFVESKNTPRYIHETKDSAETEAKRLSTKMIGSKVFVVEIVKEFKSKVIVEEI